MILRKHLKTSVLILVLSMAIGPLTGCNTKNDIDKVAKPPRATTNEQGQVDPNYIDWNKINGNSDEELTDDELTLQEIDLGYFVGSADILNTYYTFDNPTNYYSEWPTAGLYMASEYDYQQAIVYYQMVIAELEKMDLNQMDPNEARLVKYMLFDFKANAELCQYSMYTPILNPTGGRQISYPLMTSLIQFRTEEDVERYFKILEDYYSYFEAAVNLEKARSEAGIGWNDEGLDRIIADCAYMAENRDNHFLKTTFEERLEALDLKSSDKEKYIMRNENLLDTVFFPTMEMMCTRLEELKGMCNDEPFLASTEEGKKYYESLFQIRAGSGRSVEESIEILQQQIDQLYNEYYPRWEEKGIKYDFSHLSFEDACKWCERYTRENFPQISDNEVSVFEIPKEFAQSMQPACYMTSPIDHVSKHSVWLNTGLVDSPDYDMYTLVSHEMYPGHLYQHQYQYEELDNKYQVFATSIAYAEGWAEYSEWIMLHYAPFNIELAENNWKFRQLFNVLVSARLSIGVEYEGWSYEECLGYVTKYGQGQEYLDSFWSNMSSTQCYCVEYAFGYIYTSEIIEHAIAELDGICTPEEIYWAYLNLGCAPFEVLEVDMQAFIDEKKP